MVIKAPIEPLPDLAAFLAPFAHHFQRSEGREDLERYSTGQLSDLPRKNGDTIAAALPGTNAQRIQELLTRIQWDVSAFNAQRIEILRDGVRVGDGMLLFDDTGFAKQGAYSVGVARQYSGTLGKVGNCQVAVTCVYADPAVSWPVDVRLYLPREWTNDPDRCAQAGVPEEVTFQTKAQIALDVLDEADRLQIPHKVIGADAGYGGDSTFLAGLEARNKRYVVAVPCDFHVEVKGQAEWGVHRADTVLKDVARSAWKTVAWREGSKGWLRKRFVALRVYAPWRGNGNNWAGSSGSDRPEDSRAIGNSTFPTFPRRCPWSRWWNMPIDVGILRNFTRAANRFWDGMITRAGCGPAFIARQPSSC